MRSSERGEGSSTGDSRREESRSPTSLSAAAPCLGFLILPVHSDQIHWKLKYAANTPGYQKSDDHLNELGFNRPCLVPLLRNPHPYTNSYFPNSSHRSMGEGGWMPLKAPESSIEPALNTTNAHSSFLAPAATAVLKAVMT